MIETIKGYSFQANPSEWLLPCRQTGVQVVHSVGDNYISLNPNSHSPKPAQNRSKDSKGQHTFHPFFRLPTSFSCCHWENWSPGPRWVCCQLPSSPSSLTRTPGKIRGWENRIWPSGHGPFGQSFLLWTHKIIALASWVLRELKEMIQVRHSAQCPTQWPWHVPVIITTEQDTSLRRHSEGWLCAGQAPPPKWT